MKNIDVGMSLTLQNLRMRFEQSKIGIVWFFIEPLLFIAIFYLVFSNIMVSQIDHYAFYLCVGIIPWTFFSAALHDASRSLFTRQNLIRNTALDLRVIPFSFCLAHTVSFVVSLVVLLVIMGCSGIFPSHLSILLLPVVIGLHVAFCYGLCLFFSILAVLLRDVLYGMHLLLMVWFYATPIFYTRDMVPVKLQWVVDMNPLTYFVAWYRTILIGNGTISGRTVVIIILCVIGSLFIGNIIFQKNARNVIKEL